jgi:DNA-directed RNA polymerase-3 subunit RPC5
MDDETDPIVYERNVYLSRQLHGNLLLLQYPVRSTGRNYDHSHVLATRVKPRQQCVELELALDTKSRHYSVTGAKDSNCKDKQVLTSTPSGAEVPRYAIGVLTANELHLTPLSSIVQLRPNYSYIDAGVAQLASESTAVGGGESSQDEAEEDAARTVTVRFRPHESEDALARRMASYEHHRQMADEEAWVAVGHCPVGSEESEIERLQLFADQTTIGATAPCSEFYTTPTAFQRLLIPRMEADVLAATATLPSNVLSLAALKTMSFADRIRALIRSVRAMRFAELIAVMKSLSEHSSSGTAVSLDAQDVLRHLQQHAVLVQGCWVVKSDVLYPHDSHSELTGMPNEALCRARDFVLWRFEQGRAVSRKDIGLAAVHLAPEDEREILDKIARRSAAGRGWEFRMERDTEFLNDERFRAVIKRQEGLWLQWQVGKTDLKPTPPATADTTSPKQKRVRGRTKSYSGERSMSDQSDTDGAAETPRRAARKRSETAMDASVVPSHSTDTASAVAPTNVRGVLDKAVIASSSSEEIREHRIVSIESTSLSSSVANPVPKELVDFARERLAQRTVLTVSSLRMQLDLFLASAPAGSALGTVGLSSTPQMLEQALNEAGATRIEAAASGRGTDVVYVLAQRGDLVDAVRAVVVDMLSVRQTLKLGSLRKRIEDAGVTLTSGAVPSDNDLRAVLKEFCVTRGGCWSLKEMANSTSTDC